MKVYLVTIDTEDCEKHRYIYNYKPTVKEYKEKFFTENDGVYEKRDWNVCIGHEVVEFNVITK